MKVFYSDQFTIPLPRGHRFPMAKYQHLREILTAEGDERLCFRAAPAVSRTCLCRAHASDYVARVFDGTLSSIEIRTLGLPWSPALVERSRRSVGATLAALEAARNDGVAVSLAGGTHHADTSRGAGFCVFNDIAVAAYDVLARQADARVLVVDCDVHQGEGTAAILGNCANAYTFSIHSARNFPHHKGSSDLDIGLPDGCDDGAYLEALVQGLDHAFARARPGVVVFVAGADVYAGDRLGRLALSRAGILERDRLVLAAAERVNAATVVVMGGGYTPDIADSVAIHRHTVLAAADSWSRRQLTAQALRAPARVPP